MIYDDKNIYYNTPWNIFAKSDKLSNKQYMYSPHNEPFVFFYKCYEFLHGTEQNIVHCKDLHREHSKIVSGLLPLSVWMLV